MYTFEKFPVYINAEQVYRKLITIININNKSIPMFLRQQIDRASTSIIQNTAEGAGRYSRKDKKNFNIIARGSVHGYVSVLRILKIKKEITESLFNELYNDFEEISKMLSGLINSMLSE